jgi:hypothetical protein
MASSGTTTSPDAATALAEAQTALDAATAHYERQRQAAAQDRHEANAAAATARAMIDAAAGGGEAGLSVAEHADADLRAAQLDHAAGIAEALAQGALRRREQAEIAFYHALAADHVARVHAAVAAEIVSAEEIDVILVHLHELFDRFRARAEDAARATVRAAAFDDNIRGALANNVTAMALPSHEMPKTRIRPHMAASGVVLRLMRIDGFKQLHHLMGDLAPWRRALWGPMAPASDNPGTGRMLPSVSIMGSAL